MRSTGRSAPRSTDLDSTSWTTFDSESQGWTAYSKKQTAPSSESMLAHAAFALLQVEDVTHNDLKQILAKIADREPDLRLAA